MAVRASTLDIDTMPTIPPENLVRVVQDGDLLFGSGRYWVSRLIQATTASPWSHVAILRAGTSTREIRVIEAVEDDGVREVPLSRYLLRYDGCCPYEGRIVLARVDGLAAHQAADVLAKAALRMNRPFDNAELVRILARILLKRRRREHRDGDYMCSELVHECFREAGVPLKANPWGFTSPASIWSTDTVRPLGRID